MTISAWMLIGICLSMTGSAGLLVWWSWKNGQFDDTEGIKYRMMSDEY
ncbi:MAG: cbb3-type cytochrome oxidase assembly protein CcoS [Tumebacillaceae bacterium]